MKYFVDEQSIVRKIWGKTDTILFIFGGAAAEFALNKAVDWLYFTGKLPNDPIGRLFSTVTFAQKIIFEKEEKDLNAIRNIVKIHSKTETDRDALIPDWAYRDVLYMLIYYSISAYELLENRLSNDEKEEVFKVFIKLGKEMNLKNLPTNYNNWLIDRENHLKLDTQYSDFTFHLLHQYKLHLGDFRYRILLEVQKLLVPKIVFERLKFKSYSKILIVLLVYKNLKNLQFVKWLKFKLLPKKYESLLKSLDFYVQ